MGVAHAAEPRQASPPVFLLDRIARKRHLDCRLRVGTGRPLAAHDLTDTFVAPRDAADDPGEQRRVEELVEPVSLAALM